jgi:hypothetical protein
MGIGAIVMAVMAVVSAAYGAYSQNQASKQAEANQDAMAEQERVNAERAAQEKENQAEQERLNRAAEAKEERKQQRRRKALMEGAYAKSGVLLDGTPGQYLTAQSETDELEVQRGNQRSEARALGLQINGEALKSEGYFNSNMMKAKADAYGRQANSSLIAGGLNVASSAAGSYYSWMGKQSKKGA